MIKNYENLNNEEIEDKEKKADKLLVNPDDQTDVKI
jgi:hypothetical protein